jgi:hypothetical protein
MTVRDALTSALDEEMARDKDVFILGEEVRERERASAREGGGDSGAPETPSTLMDRAKPNPNQPNPIKKPRSASTKAPTR